MRQAPLHNMAAATIGSYKGTPITAGTQAQVNAQVQAVNSKETAQTNLSNSGLSGGTLNAANSSLSKIYDTPIGVGGAIDTKTGQIISGPLTGQQAADAKAVPAPAPQPPTPLAPGAAATAQTAAVPAQTTASANLAAANLSTPSTGMTDVGTTDTTAATHAALTAAGVPAPSSASDARTQIANVTPEPNPQPNQSLVDAAMQTPELAALTKLATDYFSPDNQRVSLLDQYNQMYKESGLAGLDEKILNASNIINGTEDDIRSEIQKAGGFGTDSQVQAMAQARNKVLLQNYNTLVQQKATAEAHLNTMIGLAGQDRAYAQQQFTAQIGLVSQLANFRQQAVNNVKEGFNNLVAKVGYGGAYQAYKNDPQQLSMLEQTMGLPSGGLKKLSTYVVPLTPIEQAQVEASRASTAASYSTIAKNNADIVANAQAKQAAITSSVNTADTVLGKVNTAINQTGIGTAGFGSGIISLIGGTGASNLRSTINTIKSNLAFTELAKMRAASPTGGALGAISDKEEELLSSTVASLDASQSPSQLRANLTLVKDHYVNYIKSLGYDYDEATGTIITP